MQPASPAGEVLRVVLGRSHCSASGFSVLNDFFFTVPSAVPPWLFHSTRVPVFSLFS
jgi:hypothetical protein